MVSGNRRYIILTRSFQRRCFSTDGLFLVVECSSFEKPVVFDDPRGSRDFCPSRLDNEHVMQESRE